MCGRTGMKHVYQGVQGACPRQAVTSAGGTAEHQRAPCRRHGSKACLIYKENTVTKHLRNRSCKRPSFLYTEPRKRRLPRTVHKRHQQTNLFPLNHHHHPPPLRHCVTATTSTASPTTTNNDHLPCPSFDAPNHHCTPRTTTMWQRHVTSPTDAG